MRAARRFAVLMAVSSVATIALAVSANVIVLRVLDVSAPTGSDSFKQVTDAGGFFVSTNGPLPEATIPGALILVVVLALAAALLVARGRPRAGGVLCFVVAGSQLLFALHLVDLARTEVWMVSNGIAWHATDSAVFDQGHADLNAVAIGLVVAAVLAAMAGISAWRTSGADRLTVSSSRLPLLQRGR